MPRLQPNHQHHTDATSRLSLLLTNIPAVGPTYQKMIAELALLRLHSLLEGHIRSISIKIVCGASYIDGLKPILVQRCPSEVAALNQMKSFGRPKALPELRWTKAADVTKNVRFLVDPSDPLFTTLRTHSQFIDELRRLRNHISHRSPSTRVEFRPVVARYYGAYVPTITPGTLLLSARWSPPLLARYLITSRVVVRDLTRA